MKKREEKEKKSDEGMLERGQKRLEKDKEISKWEEDREEFFR